ncbi:hypothetical protein OTU49_003725 [Cherax quadricarinatus]|uniref:Uncharacterized protein n=2 Tax=Cherax quadricarinatus TaxID=27406 RepID=A0AAW0XLK5_CHEQU
MAESDHESSTNESNMRKFFRGILPHWPSSSPQGGATPIHSEAAETGNEEVSCRDKSQLKRKSLLSNDNNESEDSEYEEILPSCKRQRITVSAMSRLFAKFSLHDREPTDIPPTSQGEKDGETYASRSDDKLKSAVSSKASQQNLNSSKDTSVDTSTGNINNNNEDIPNMNKNSTELKQVKRDNITTDINETSERKRQKTDKITPVHEEKSEELQKKDNTTSEDTGKTNKRQAEVNESDAEGDEEHASKVKRTRRLRRGLRLCTNITCYIEQVLYN